MKFDRYCRMAFYLTKEKLTVNHKEHKELAQAVLSRDEIKAEKLTKKHIMGALESVIITYKQNTLM